MAGNGERTGGRREDKVSDTVYPNGEVESYTQTRKHTQPTEPTHLIPETAKSLSRAPSTTTRTQPKKEVERRKDDDDNNDNDDDNDGDDEKSVYNEDNGGGNSDDDDDGVANVAKEVIDLTSDDKGVVVVEGTAEGG